ncbi:Auxin efflux carrier component [Rhynchospora pubera]|uniref:Auxin efflux carrier component n=1 Tax=Rhynchospora pubera TaxID=906938 RepID=A0AAV8BPN7_9POAL|nr:Auxin efflux carrier component [Rhynchospora pubera]
MIGMGDIYKVLEAMVPLYFALALGYGSIQWWQIFTPAECDTINRLVSYFAFPFFAFRFTLNTDPYSWNYRAIAGDVIAKVLIIGSLAAWTKYSSKGNYAWAITSFSLTTLTNALVMGVPLLDAMYGNWAGDLVVQLAVFQAVTWLTLLLFVLELKKALEEMREEMVEDTSVDMSDQVAQVQLTRQVTNGHQVIQVELTRQVTNGRQENVNQGEEVRNNRDNTQVVATNDLESGNIMAVAQNRRYDFKLPGLLDGCVYIMARTGTGMAMFSMGIFMATQEKALACGTNLTLFGMALRFIAGPLAMAIGCFVVGLRGDVLRVAIIQAAVPQSITSFVYAQEYGLHAQVISTAKARPKAPAAAVASEAGVPACLRLILLSTVFFSIHAKQGSKSTSITGLSPLPVACASIFPFYFETIEVVLSGIKFEFDLVLY